MELNRGLSAYLAQAVQDAAGVPGDDGRPADFSRNDDARACLDLMHRLRTIVVPHGEIGPCQYAATYWKGFVPALRSSVPFGGQTLSLTDWDPGNIVVSGGRAFIKVWYRPMIAATWIDTAAAILGFIAEGRDPGDAETLFLQDTALAHCAAEYLTRFILTQQSPPSDPGERDLKLTDAARRWFGYDRARGPRTLIGGKTA